MITEASPHSETSSTSRAGNDAPRVRIRLLTALVLVVGIALTTVLTVAVNVNTNNSLNHLLSLRAQQVATALRISVPTIQDRIVAAYDDSQAAGFNPTSFVRSVKLEIGRGGFTSVSLWEVKHRVPRLIVNVGAPPAINSSPHTNGFFMSIHPSATMFVTGILPGKSVGYAIEPATDTRSMIVYAESALPGHQIVSSNSGFEDLNFALYLGKSADRSGLIESTVSLPVRGRTAIASVPFGDSFLTVVATPATPLEGALSQDLPIIVGLAAGLLTVLAAVIAETLLRARDMARQATRRTEESLEEQRSIATSLQRAMLPDELPSFPGASIAVTYLPGKGALDVGGDWYDIIGIDVSRFYVVIGDVSGRGLRAARTMAALRYAIRAYVAQGDTPQAILGKLGGLLDLGKDGQFATVLMGEVDVERHSMSAVNAGHMPLLLVSGQDGRYVQVPVGPPVGVITGTRPRAVSVSIPPDGLLIAFTDGLVEHKGEGIDVGLERLRLAATELGGSAESILASIVSQLAPDGAEDDIAMLGVQWLS
jgi:serine phosphatase RsbU (regulator of sigma subunit)